MNKKRRRTKSPPPFSNLIKNPQALLCQSALCLLNEHSKGRLVIYCNVSKDLTIDFHRSLLKTADKSAVRKTVLTSCSVDTHNPQLTELTLLLTTIAISILTGLGNSLHCRTVATRTSTVVTLGSL